MSHKQPVRRRHLRSPGKRSDLARRQTNEYRETPAYDGYYPEPPSYSTGSFITGPLTFTIVRTITPSPTQYPDQPSASTSMTSTPLSVPPVGWGPSSSSSTLDSSSPAQSSQSTPTTSASAVVEQESASPQSPEETETEANSRAGPLPPGAVIGLIIAAIFITIALIAFFLRRRYVRRRIRLRKEWSKSKSVKPAPESGFDFSFGEGSSRASSIPSPFVIPPTPSPTPSPTRPSNQPVEMVSRGSPIIAAHFPLPPLAATPRPPAASYGTDYSPRATTRTAKKPAPAIDRSTSPTKKLPTPIYGPATVLPKPLSAVVVSTFITSLPDELDVTTGETVQIVAEFDDDWALCLNSAQVQGMVPLECLNRSASGRGRAALGLSELSLGPGGRLKRVSSLNPKLRVSGRF